MLIRDSAHSDVVLNGLRFDFEQVDVIRLLVEGGARVNAQDSNGYTALMHAVAQNKVEAAEELLESDADVNTKSWSGLTVRARLFAGSPVQSYF